MSESLEAAINRPPAILPLKHNALPVSQQRPTARQWIGHAALFLLTFVTATIAGVTFAISDDLAEPDLPLPATWIEHLLYYPDYYFHATGAIIYQALTQPALLSQGIAFAIALLLILTAHESGHYIACRCYKVAATLPFFIPAPPFLGAGTFGAFIKIKAPIPSRRALFDIGVAGPLAGFIFIIPIFIIGLITAHPVISSNIAVDAANQHAIVLSDPLLFRLVALSLGASLDIFANPFYMAAWIGALVTSLNLLPVGQLDGAHAVYSVFGARAHKWTGRVVFILMCALAVLNLTWHGSPSGFLYAILLAVMLHVRHPQPVDATPLDGTRLIIAALTLLVFILCFMPFPITIT
jgi:membrane-associated protease RseP (regulator of RpoE activity)